MTKIPGFYALFTAVLMALSVASAAETSTYDVAYQYCVTGSTCYDLDNLPGDVDLGFMTPKIDQFTDAADTPIQLVPNIYRYDSDPHSALKFKVQLLDDQGSPLADLAETEPNGTDIWSFQDIAAQIRAKNIAGVKKIVLSYTELLNASGEVPEIEIENPKRFDFGIAIYGYDKNSSMVEIIESSASEMSTYGEADYGAAMRIKDIKAKGGYSFDSSYSAIYQYSAMLPNNGCSTNDTVRIGASETTSSFASVEDLLSKMSECGTVEWTVKTDTLSEPVVLNNVKTATHAARRLYQNSTITEKLTLIPGYSLVNYNVTFDLQLPSAHAADSSSIFVGRTGEKASKPYTVEGPVFPKIYATACPNFIAWSPVSDASLIPFYFNNNYVGMNAQFIEYAERYSNLDSINNTTAYGYWNDGCTAIDLISLNYAIAFDGVIDSSNAPHVMVTLKQTFGGNVIKHTMSNEEIPNNAGKYIHQTLLPVADDTLTFVVNYKTEPGYTVDTSWFEKTEKSSGATKPPLPTSETVDFELHALNLGKTDTTLVVNTTTYSSMTLNVSLDYTKYMVTFIRPTVKTPVDKNGDAVDYYVSDRYLESSWPDSKIYTVESGSDWTMPEMYALDGCIAWSTEKTFDASAPLVKKFDTSVAEKITSSEDLYPIYYTAQMNPRCNDAGQSYTVTAHGENLKGVELWQIIGVDDDVAGTKADTIRHVLAANSDSTEFTLQVPKVMDRSSVTLSYIPFTFVIHVDPIASYTTDSKSFYQKSTTTVDSTFITDLKVEGDGDSIDFFIAPVKKKPSYVTYDLSLQSDEDYANTYVSTIAKKTEKLEYTDGIDSLVFWMPYRTDKCFAGWSANTAQNFDPSMDSLYYVYSPNNDGDFSTNPDNPTTLYAIWNNCTVRDGALVLKNGSENVTLAVYQLFGDDTLRHAITSDQISLPLGSEFEFYLDSANTVPALGYSYREGNEFRLSRIDGYDEETVNLGNGVFRMTAEGIYTFAADVEVEQLNTLYVTYDLNPPDGVYENVFVPNGAQQQEVLTYSKYDQRIWGWSPYHTKYCFAGWRSEQASWHDLWHDGTFLVSGAKFLSADPERPTQLIAEWVECTHQDEPIVITNNNKNDGVPIVLNQKFGDMEIKHVLGVGDSLLLEKQGYEFYIDGYNPNGSVAEISQEWKGRYLVSCQGTQSCVEDGFAVTPVFVFTDGGFMLGGPSSWDIIPDSIRMLPNFLDVDYAQITYFINYEPGEGDSSSVMFPWVDFTQSGRAILLNYTCVTGPYDSRNVRVWARVIDAITGEDVIKDSLVGDSITNGYSGDVVLRIPRSGTFEVMLTVEDGYGKDVFRKEFTISDVIASVAREGWQLVPLAVIDTSAVQWDSDDQIFYWWDESGTGEYWQYKQFTRGDAVNSTRGAWYSSLDSLPLVLRTDMDDNAEDMVWELDSVSSGWNLMANTHGWSVDLYSNGSYAPKEFEEDLEIEFYRYNSTTGGYEWATMAKPYEALWAKVHKKTEWWISAQPIFWEDMEYETKHHDPHDWDNGLYDNWQSDPNQDWIEQEKNRDQYMPKRALAKALNKERWTLQAVLSDRNGKQDAWNVFGAGLNPFTAEEPPEGIGDHVNLSIVEGKKGLAKSFKASADDMEWNLALSASDDRVGDLVLVGIDGVKALGYHVYVTVDGNTTEMQEGIPLKVYLKSSAKMATVRVTSAAKTIVQNTLRGLRSARLGDKLQVSFEASEGLAGTNARVDILDMKGNVMSTVLTKTVEGANALVLDAPKTGLYMLRVRAGSQLQVGKIMVK